MIVVVGNPAWRASEPVGPAGLACGIALAAAGSGAAVELVGRAGDDAAGDALVLALARGGVGHVALLRDPARPTPPGPVTTPGEPAAGTEDPEPAIVQALHAEDEASSRPAPAAAAPVLEPADVALGLRYLTAYRVVVVADDVPAPVLPVAAEAAAFAGAHLVVLVGEGSGVPEGLPEAATVLAAPPADPDGVFAAFVGGYASALDAGAAPGEAFSAARSAGWEAGGA